MKNSVILFLVLLSTSIWADVWESKDEWTPEHELKYQQWIENDYHRRIFSNPESPYYGVLTDCADVAYAARIIFSFENKLPFKIKNPERKGLFASFYISNKQNTFDKLKKEIDRVKAFINKVAVHSGTYNLAKNDTYPIAIKDIKPGDLYITQHNGIKHAYVVKKIYTSGVMDLYYSTLPRVVREIKFHRGIPLFTFSESPWGFRRFKNPEQLSSPEKEIPGFSLEQYELLKKFGPERVLSEISNLLRQEEEGLEGKVMRLVENLCRSMEDRIDSVNRSIEYVSSINGRCVNMAEYQNYSTPGLDNRIVKQVKIIEKFWKNISESEKEIHISSNLESALNKLIFNEYENSVLLCEGQDKKFDPIEFYFKFNDGKISPHPNATFDARWGDEKNNSNCQVFN